MMNERGLALALSLLFIGCTSEDIPQAHRGRMFDRTGALAMWSGGKGFEGPILGPGTYYTGYYDEVRKVECSQETEREPLESLTKDGVQFKLDVYVTFNPECADPAVEWMLANLSAMDPNKVNTISAKQLYNTYVRPAIGEVVRETISPHRANDVNDKREEILNTIRKRFMEAMGKMSPKLVVIHNVVLSNLDFPDEMDHANTERAVQAVLKDKAIAEREKVEAEIQTMGMRRELESKEGEAVAAKIDKIGEALRRNPDYLQYDMQNRMEGIYAKAGDKGNLIIAAPSPSLIINPKK